jgi:hypothetical protein
MDEDVHRPQGVETAKFVFSRGGVEPAFITLGHVVPNLKAKTAFS